LPDAGNCLMTTPTETTKRRWPLKTAMPLARLLVKILEPACERICIAGSLRRGKPEVGDIEIVYVPKVTKIPDGLFSETIESNQADKLIVELVANGILNKRPSKNGTFSWGEKNKLAMHPDTEIPVDLFATTVDAWWNYLVCRTGSAQTNMRIAMAAQRKGWKWNPYGAGFSRRHEIAVMKSEMDVFEFVGLPYLEPEER
jgi:DNA polymerase/3'-5' exonuclease PolX